jgi:hypothetical protein
MQSEIGPRFGASFAKTFPFVSLAKTTILIGGFLEAVIRAFAAKAHFVRDPVIAEAEMLRSE